MGALSSMSAVDLAAVAIRAALDRSGVMAESVEAIVFGNVVQAGAGPNVARQAAVAAGVPFTAHATTINKLCLSGLTAVAQADQLISLGRHDIVVAGGCESMSSAPHLLSGSRRGKKFGEAVLRDALEVDALICAFDGVSMGAATEKYQAQYGISREAQDAFSARSHQRAAAAREAGLLDDEIVPVSVAGRSGATEVHHDEGVRDDATAAGLASLAPAFASDGTITAGSASQLSDGACAMVIMSKARAENEGLEWIAEVGEYGTVAGPDPSLPLQPARAINDALERDGRLSAADLDVVEVNEAFAGVALASASALGLSDERINMLGGAVAIGHPVGMSGARLALTVAYQLKNTGGQVGVAALCGGGGQGDALLLRAPR
jgi:acetyl-CoA C-acetyltransferase